MDMLRAPVNELAKARAEFDDTGERGWLSRLVRTPSRALVAAGVARMWQRAWRALLVVDDIVQDVLLQLASRTG